VPFQQLSSHAAEASPGNPGDGKARDLSVQPFKCKVRALAERLDCSAEPIWDAMGRIPMKLAPQDLFRVRDAAPVAGFQDVADRQHVT